MLNKSWQVTPTRHYYVTPTNDSPCQHLVDHAPCLIFEDYVNPSDIYFVNNTVFYFYPGTHRLNASLILINVHNVTMQGLPGNETVLIVLDTMVNITWDICYGVEISSIPFELTSGFSYGIAFKQSHLVRLFNVTILGSDTRGQSLIMSQNSSLDIVNSKFFAIKGYIGAALEFSDASGATFTGNNSFKHNMAKFSGAIYSLDSVLIFNGTNTFINNSGSTYGGGIETVLSDVTFAGTVSFIGNLAIMGAFSMDSKVTVQGKMNFASNATHFSRGIALTRTSKQIMIPPIYVSFIQNYTKIAGGALFVKNDNCPSQSFVPPGCFFSTSSFVSRANISLFS